MTKYFMLIHGTCSQLNFDKLGRAWYDIQRGKLIDLPTVTLPEDAYISFVPVPADYSSKKYITIVKGMSERQLDIFNKIMDCYDQFSPDWVSKSLPCINVTLNGGIEFKEMPNF